VASTLFHAQPSVSLILYILSVILDGQCLAFSILNTKYFVIGCAVQLECIVHLSDPCLNSLKYHYAIHTRR